MRPNPVRLFVVFAASAALLAVAASGVFAAGDLSACTLVASEGTHPNPVGTILEAVDATRSCSCPPARSGSPRSTR
jgi:hypothetical protein